MFARSFALLAATLAVSVAAVPAMARTPHENRNHTHTDPASIPWGAESKRLAEECRRDPENGEKRRALKRALERDFDRYIAARRSKIKGGKKHSEARKRLDKVIRERDRVINGEINRLVGRPVPDGGERPPKPPRKKR